MSPEEPIYMAFPRLFQAGNFTINLREIVMVVDHPTPEGSFSTVYLRGGCECSVDVPSTELQAQWKAAIEHFEIDPMARALAGLREIDLYPMRWRGLVEPVTGTLCAVTTAKGERHEFNARASNLRTTVLSAEQWAQDLAVEAKAAARRAQILREQTEPAERALRFSRVGPSAVWVHATPAPTEGDWERPVVLADDAAPWAGAAPGLQRRALCTVSDTELVVRAWLDDEPGEKVLADDELPY